MAVGVAERDRDGNGIDTDALARFEAARTGTEV